MPFPVGHNIIFRGDTNWQQVKQAEWSQDSWGLDHARVLYRGPSTKKIAFNNNIRRWGAMIGYPGMKLEGWSDAIITPSYPGVEFQFVGFRSGNLPPVKPVDSFSTQVAQGQGRDTATGRNVSGSFTYRASRTTYTWFETSLPNPQNPRYAIPRNALNPLSQILSYSIQDDNGKKVNTIPFSAFTAVFNSLSVGIQVSDYEREEIIPKALWACRSTVDYAIR